jgi:RimJ/RimL family protein N-acetyltransferase
MPDIIFKTERLYFRQPAIDDAPAMQAIKQTNWSEIQKWMSWSFDDQFGMDATIDFITKFTPADAEKGGCIMFAFHKDTHDLVMVGGYNATDEIGVVTTGYWGNIDYLGQGYATEKTHGMIDYIFNQTSAHKIVITYYDDNHASRRVIEKCGFEFVETLPQNHKCHLNGDMMDEHCYALTRDQWMERRHTP